MSEYHHQRANDERVRERADATERQDRLRVKREDVREPKGPREAHPDYVLSCAARFAAVCSALSNRAIQDFGSDNKKTNDLRKELRKANVHLAPSDIRQALKEEYAKAARLLDDDELNLVIIDSTSVMEPVIKEAVLRQKNRCAQGISALQGKVEHFMARTEGDAVLDLLDEFEEEGFFVSDTQGPHTRWARFTYDIREAARAIVATGPALKILPSTVRLEPDRPSQKERDPMHAPENIVTQLRVIERQLSPLNLLALRMRVDTRYAQFLDVVKQIPKKERTERNEAKLRELEQEREGWRSKVSALSTFRKQVGEAIKALVDIDKDVQEFSSLRSDILGAEQALDRTKDIRLIPQKVSELAQDRAEFFTQRMMREGATLDWVTPEYREQILSAHAELAKSLKEIAEEWAREAKKFQKESEGPQYTVAA